MAKTKLFEHGTGEHVVVTEKKLQEMQQAPSFRKVFRNDGPATEEDVAAYNKRTSEAGGEVASEEPAATTKPSGTPLPASPTTTGNQGTGTKPSGTANTAGTAGGK